MTKVILKIEAWYAIRFEAKVRIRTGVVMLCRHLRSRSATLALVKASDNFVDLP